ncbi:hypothetical protein ACI5KX_13010 [Erythrobacter sp. GH1-10]|uniref:hypothetical protein n=1 Tax=Erythrobacter sp. GH1-10 TaxID=3349334 RepID=UPI003877C630
MSAPAAVRAQDNPSGLSETPEVVDRLFACREISDPDARLACFDREADAVYAARESRELVIAEREDIDEARRGLFGLKLPNIRLFGGGDDDEGLNEISATLAGATKLRNGRHIFELEDGARWIETEDVSGYRRFQAGDTIVIEQASLGSYKAKVDGKRAVRVRRIN